MKLTLLMTITPPDCGISKYSLLALKRLRNFLDYDLCVYLNGLSAQDEVGVKAKMKDFSSVVFKSNRDWLNPKNLRVGEKYKTDFGANEFRQGLYESSGEVWSREVVLLNTPLVGIIDADFEIFDASFVSEMVDSFSLDHKLGFYSTDYAPTRKLFDTYAQVGAFLMERWDTWFCIYRKEALEQFHDFSYKEIGGQSALPMKYDHAAWLQKELKSRGWEGKALSRIHEWKYLHYGAFAKNKTLVGKRLAVYRIFRILRQNGFRYLHRSAYLSMQLMRVGSLAYRLLGLGAYDRQRGRYIFHQDQTSDSWPD